MSFRFGLAAFWVTIGECIPEGKETFSALLLQKLISIQNVSKNLPRTGLRFLQGSLYNKITLLLYAKPFS